MYEMNKNLTNRAIAKEVAIDLESSDALNYYLAQLRETPLLSKEQEEELFFRLQNADDMDAAKKLVMSHLRFVVHIAKTYKGYGLPLLDIIQEGNVGLMKAVKKFDPSKKVRLLSFAIYWIRVFNMDLVKHEHDVLVVGQLLEHHVRVLLSPY